MQAQKVSNRERVVSLIMLTESLADIIGQEVEVLAERRPAELVNFEQEKTRLAKVYASEMSRFRKDNSPTADVPEGLLHDLKMATGRLRDRLDTQSTVLTGLKTVSERMVQAIAKEVTKTRAPETAYASNATYAPATGRGTAFAVNRTA